MGEPIWMFKKYKPDDTQRDSVSGEFFKNTRLESVIREAIQNSLDAREGGKGTATVHIYYSGEETAVSGEAYAKAFRQLADEHYCHKKSGLENVPAANEKCVFLLVEDFKTTGLTGDVSIRPTDEELENDRIKGNYYNYFFRENRSDKAGNGALGSWGAGKIMFMKASRLRTAFTLSVREDAKAPRFLAGRTVLMSHSIGNDTYAPDGWFGIDAKTDNPPSRYLRKQPIVESKLIDGFSKLFRLKRKATEKGTSIVIPYLNVENENGDGEFSKENIARAVIKNFLIAILNADLEVQIETGTDGKMIVLNKEELATAKKYLPVDPDAKSGLVTRRHYDLAAKTAAADFPAAQFVTLKHVSPNLKSVWSDEIFAGQDLKAIKKTLLSGKPFVFKVPMTVQEKGKDGKQKLHADSFDVAIARADDVPESFRPAFYRIGLLIDSAARKAFTGYVALINIADGELAKLLVASEPPSHNEWDSGSERVKKSYFNTAAHINFVTSAVGEILGRIEAADQEPDQHVLIGSFGIPLDEKDPDDRKPPKTPDETKPDEAKDPDEDKDKGEIPEELVHLEKFKSKIGFTLSMSADRVAEKGYPFVAPYRMGYAPFTKSSWSRFDFRLGKDGTIKIEHEKPAQADIVEIEAEDNRLKLKVKKSGAFRIYVTGFDENRDLEVVKMHYDYSGVN